MKRRDLVLLTLIVAELVTGAALLGREWARPVPPAADLALIDPLTASELRTLHAGCHSLADWARLGEAYQAFGYFAESEACYRYVCQREPARGDRAYEWAFALERLGLIEEANAQYERAIELDFDRPEACWYFIGRNHLRREDAAASRSAFEKARDLPGAQFEIARLLSREGDRAGALAILDRLTAYDPEAVQPWLLRHRLEALEDGPGIRTADRAERARSRLLTPLDRECARLEAVGHQFLGTTREWRACQELIAAGQHDQARSRLREALNQQWDPGLSDLLAEAEMQVERYDQAVRLLEQIIDRAGPSVQTLTRLGAAHYRAGRPDEAAQLWSRAARLGVGGAVRNLYYKLASYHQEKGDKKAAQWHYARAYHAAGHEAFWAGQLPAAQVALTKATEYDSGMAASWHYLGETQRLQGQNALARKAYQRCLEINPDHGRARVGLSLLDLPGR